MQKKCIIIGLLVFLIGLSACVSRIEQPFPSRAPSGGEENQGLISEPDKENQSSEATDADEENVPELQVFSLRGLTLTHKGYESEAIELSDLYEYYRLTKDGYFFTDIKWSEENRDGDIIELSQYIIDALESEAEVILEPELRLINGREWAFSTLLYSDYLIYLALYYDGVNMFSITTYTSSLLSITCEDEIMEMYDSIYIDESASAELSEEDWDWTDGIIPEEIVCEFVSEEDTLFTFSEDGTYGFYKSVHDRSDNYYAGSIKIEPWDNNMLLNIDGSPSNYYAKLAKEGKAYSLKLMAGELHSEGIDKSDILSEDAYYWFIWVVIDDGNAKAVNIETDAHYTLTRIK